MTATTNQIFLNGNTLYHLIAFYKLIMWFVLGGFLLNEISGKRAGSIEKHASVLAEMS